MGILGDGKDGRSRRAAAPLLAPSGSSSPAAPPTSPSGPISPSGPEGQGVSELRRRRDVLAEEVAELHWDLGGLAYEMAIRDHFRLDVLVRRAGILQERDAELAELERLLHLEESASAGACPYCSAPHSRGALFCWQCGATLMERSPASATAADASAPIGADGRAPIGADGASTAIMDALLVPSGDAQDAPTQAIPPRATPPPAAPPAEIDPDAMSTEAIPTEGLGSEAVTSSEE